jgi:hypothetical protein
MSENGRRYVFSGHAVGVAAQFHRLGELTGLNHVVPTLGAAVLPVTGGLSHSRAQDYDYKVDEPWSRSLLKVKHVQSKAHGAETRDGYQTEVTSEIDEIGVVEKLHIERVVLHMSSTKSADGPPEIRTSGNKIDGMRLGKVYVHVDLDDDTLCSCGTKQQLADFYAAQSGDYRQKNSWRFHTQPDAAAIQEHSGYYKCTLARDIRLSGPADEVARISVEGNRIYWPGFGRIFVAEVLVGARERRMTMVRLAMGSDAGGSGSIGDAGTNGSVST